MRIRHLIAGNTLVQFIGKAVTAGTTFIVTILIARSYGVTGFGEFTKITTYVSLFYLIADFGMNAVFLREEQSERAGEKSFSFVTLLSTRFIWTLIMGMLALIIVVFLPAFEESNTGFTPLVKLGIIILLPTIVTQGVFVSCNALFQKNLRYDLSVIAAILGSIAIVSFVTIATAIHVSLVFLLLSYVIGGIILMSAAWLLSSRYRTKLTLVFPRLFYEGKALFVRSLPLGVTLLFNLIYFRADIFLLTLYRSTEEVGVYGLATKVFELPLTIPIFLMNAVYPILLKLTVKSEKMEAIKKTLIVLLGLSLVVTLAGFILAPFFILIKEEFIASVVPFRVLLLSLPVFFISSLYMWVFIAEGKRWRLSAIYGSGMILNILLNLIFIPRFGIMAAAVITGVSELYILILLVVTFRRFHFNASLPKIPQQHR